MLSLGTTKEPHMPHSTQTKPQKLSYKKLNYYWRCKVKRIAIRNRYRCYCPGSIRELKIPKIPPGEEHKCHSLTISHS